MSSACAFAPASIGNVAVGFDILGQSFAGPGDRATVRRVAEPVVRIEAIRGCVSALPIEAERNTAGRALIALREALGLPFGFSIELDKGIAMGSGMGGSAASCVAALVAANALLDRPLHNWNSPPDGARRAYFEVLAGSLTSFSTSNSTLYS